MSYQKGFTLIEIMVVLGIFIVIISFSAVVDLNVFKSDTLQTEESKVVSLLEKARSRSMANLYGTSHGFCYISPNYVLFRESDGHCVDGVSSNELIPANTNIASNASTSLQTIKFDQLSGNTTSNTMNLSDGNKTVHIIINNEGTINW